MGTTRWVVPEPGVRLPYVVLGSGDAPRLLFAHSLLASAVQGAGVFQPIVDEGWTVLAMDQRGHGGAEGEWTAADFTLDVLGSDLLAILDDVGWATAWLGGGSLGAATSLAAALQAPERVEGILLMAPAIGAEPNPGLEQFRAIGDAFDDGTDAGVAAWNARFGAPNPAHEEALRRLGPVGAAALLRALPAWHLGALPSFDVPVVTSAWEDDPIHPKATAMALAKASPKGTFHLLDLAAEPNFFRHAARHLQRYSGS